MKFLREERIAVVAFVVSVALFSAILYYAASHC